jgi:endoglucanase
MSNPFLHRQGKKIVDADGNPVLLTGMGLGNWWLPEGYMWRFGDAVPSPRAIEAFFERLIGPEDATEFWRRYREDYIGEADVRRWQEEGWNSVRLPINARYFLEDGVINEANFAIVDRFIGWCRKYGIYVVIDLHGAAGGQTGTNIDDSPNNYPELFVHQHYQDETVALWEEIARRYKDDPIIAGYDLLNEPLPHEFQHKYPSELIALYKRLIKAIRAIDPHHMIILEGSHWARNWSIFDRLWDENTLLQFHKYWNAPDVHNIQVYLDKRDELDAPIYMGEGGENNNGWYQGSFQLYEDHDISWNFWVWKKLAKQNSPARIVAPEGWDDIVAAAHGGPDPSPEAARKTLFDFLDNLPLERCDYRQDVVNAIMRRVPLRIEAENYRYQGEGASFGLTRPGTPLPAFRTGESVTVRYRDGHLPAEGEEPFFRHNLGVPRKPEEVMVIELSAGDWVQYGFELREGRAITIRADWGGTPDAMIELRVGDARPRRLAQGETDAAIPALPAGRHTLVVRVLQGDCWFDWFDLN